MDKMIVKVPVTIKAKVTEDLKAQRTNVAMLSRSLKINWNEQKTSKSVAKSVTAHWSVPWKLP